MRVRQKTQCPYWARASGEGTGFFGSSALHVMPDLVQTHDLHTLTLDLEPIACTRFVPLLPWVLRQKLRHRGAHSRSSAAGHAASVTAVPSAQQLHDGMRDQHHEASSG